MHILMILKNVYLSYCLLFLSLFGVWSLVYNAAFKVVSSF